VKRYLIAGLLVPFADGLFRELRPGGHLLELVAVELVVELDALPVDPVRQAHRVERDAVALLAGL